MAVEQAVAAMNPRISLVSLVLDAQPAKHSMRSEATVWKAQFAKNLHNQGLQNFKVRALSACALYQLILAEELCVFAS